MQDNGLIYPNNAPGLYIAPNTKTLVVMMNTFHVINEKTVIPDIPLNKWVNVIRCQKTIVDVIWQFRLNLDAQGSQDARCHGR